MNLLRTTVAAALAVAAALPAAAQNPQQQGGTIRGTVTAAETGEPVPSAQVGVWSAADSSLVTGAVTRPDGTFRIDGVRPGSYYLRVSSLGYATASTDAVAITPEAMQADVGTVRLAQGAVVLEGLTVTAERSDAAFAPDRNTYRTRDLPATSGGNATDVLRNIPSVEVDQDGKVALRGNQNVAIQVNGRPTPMRGEQLAAFLQQLPANVVETVEVIPNPSAKYEPEGMAGIINIVLKQNADLGLSYGLQAGVGTGGRYNGSGNVGWQQGPLTLYGSYGFRSDERSQTGLNYTEAYDDPATQDLVYSLDQSIDGRFDMTSHLFNGSADYRLGARDVLSTSVMLNSGSFVNESDNLFLRRGASRQWIEGSLGENEVEMDDLTLDAALSFRHTVAPQRHELFTELRYNRSDHGIGTWFSQQPIDADGAPTNTVPLLRDQQMDALTDTWTLQADYTHPLADRSKLETGYKGTLRALDNDLGVLEYDHDAEDWVPSALSNAFQYDETVHAGYAVLSHGTGALDLQAGLRVENTAREFQLANTGESFPKDYWSFFPSGLVAYTLDPQRQVRLSYSRRIQRPDTRLLNPFGFREDQFFRFAGNPELEPEYTDAVELGYQQAFEGGSLQVTPFFRRTQNAIRRIRNVVGDTTVVTFRNLDTNDSYGADVNASLRRGRVSGFASVSAFRTVTDAGDAGEELAADAFGWTARVSGNLQVTPRLDVQGFVFYRAPMDVEQGHMSSMMMTTLGIRQKLMGERASVALRIVDPFDRMEFTMQTEDPLHYQLNEREFNARAAYLTFSYNFGQQPRLRQRAPSEPQEPAAMPGGIGP